MRAQRLSEWQVGTAGEVALDLEDCYFDFDSKLLESFEQVAIEHTFYRITMTAVL